MGEFRLGMLFARYKDLQNKYDNVASSLDDLSKGYSKDLLEKELCRLEEEIYAMSKIAVVVGTPVLRSAGNDDNPFD